MLAVIDLLIGKRLTVVKGLSCMNRQEEMKAQDQLGLLTGRKDVSMLEHNVPFIGLREIEHMLCLTRRTALIRKQPVSICSHVDLINITGCRC